MSDMKTNITKNLNMVLKKAVISDNLKKAIEGIIAAVKADDLTLACSLSACKSLIAGDMEQPSEREYYTFREDSALNEKVLKKSVYSILDSVNGDLSWATDIMPAGMMCLSVNRKTGNASFEESKPTGTHPLVKQILREKEHCAKRYSKNRKKSLKRYSRIVKNNVVKVSKR